jgi:hypothetical protein
MPDRKKSARGDKRMNKAATAKRAEEPLLGEAALKEALAGFGVTPNAVAFLAALTSTETSDLLQLRSTAKRFISLRMKRAEFEMI